MTLSTIQAKKSQSESLNTLMLVLVMLLVFFMSTRTPADPDMWWHLRAGEETIAAGRPLTVDTMTFTRYGEKWVNHSWLAQLVLVVAYKLGGPLGLSLYTALMVTATMLVLYQSLKGGVFFKALIIFLTCLVMAPLWTPRPQQFSLLLFAGLNAWLSLYLQRKTDKIWPLPLIFILWSNLHGGYSFGFMLLGITLVGLIFDRLFRPETAETLTWPEIGRLADWTAISLLAVLINPNGLSTWTIPFQTVGVELTNYIQEWESIDFHQLYTLPYLILLFACLISIGLSNRRATGAELFGLTLFGAISLAAQRLIGLFALFAAVVLANHAQAVLSMMGDHLRTTKVGERFIRWRYSRQQQPVSPGVRRGINLTLAALLAAAGIIKLAYVSYPDLVNKALESYYPVSAVDYLEDYETPGNLFSDYGWGGYLDFRLRDYKVFLDGRADLYPDELFMAWLDATNAKPGWEETLATYDVQYILLPPEMKLVQEAQQAGWKVLYQDEISVLLEPE